MHSDQLRLPYDGKVPSVKGSETSEAAAQSMQESASSIRSHVAAFISTRGDFGATCDEVELALRLRHQTASARIRELYLGSRISKSGQYRPTSSGRQAVVYVWKGDAA